MAGAGTVSTMHGTNGHCPQPAFEFSACRLKAIEEEYEASKHEAHGNITAQHSKLPRRLNSSSASSSSLPEAGQKQSRRASRFKNVNMHRFGNRWEAHIWRNKKQMHIGLFPSEMEAAVAFDLVALKLRGATTATNFATHVYTAELQAMSQMTDDELIQRVRLMARNGASRRSATPPRSPSGPTKRIPACLAPSQDTATTENTTSCETTPCSSPLHQASSSPESTCTIIASQHFLSPSAIPRSAPAPAAPSSSHSSANQSQVHVSSFLLPPRPSSTVTTPSLSFPNSPAMSPHRRSPSPFTSPFSMEAVAAPTSQPSQRPNLKRSHSGLGDMDTSFPHPGFSRVESLDASFLADLDHAMTGLSSMDPAMLEELFTTLEGMPSLDRLGSLTALVNAPPTSHPSAVPSQPASNLTALQLDPNRTRGSPGHSHPHEAALPSSSRWPVDTAATHPATSTASTIPPLFQPTVTMPQSPCLAPLRFRISAPKAEPNCPSAPQPPAPASRLTLHHETFSHFRNTNPGSYCSQSSFNSSSSQSPCSMEPEVSDTLDVELQHECPPSWNANWVTRSTTRGPSPPAATMESACGVASQFDHKLLAALSHFSHHDMLDQHHGGYDWGEFGGEGYWSQPSSCGASPWHPEAGWQMESDEQMPAFLSLQQCWQELHPQALLSRPASYWKASYASHELDVCMAECGMQH